MRGDRWKRSQTWPLPAHATVATRKYLEGEVMFYFLVVLAVFKKQAERFYAAA